MGIAALIIGIVSLLIGLIPSYGILGLFPAIAGLILGIIDIVKKYLHQKPIGNGVAGVVLCALAITIMLLWRLFIIGFAIF